MSREVRRVPLDWKHPTEPNPYWLSQRTWRIQQGRPESRLHDLQVRFVGLCGDYPDALAQWEQERDEIANRNGHRWTFGVEYHLTGYQGRDDTKPTVHPFWVWSEDCETETAVDVRDEDHLYELELARVESEKPNPDHYMPVWSDDEATGWCLYETVSEGTPVTPVFATAEELIDHLATVGQDWEQQPMRREAAEALVRSGSSLGSFVMAGGVLYDSANDADKLAERLGGAS